MLTSHEVLDALIKSEGGYVHHASDRGGPTNMGITLSTLRRWRSKSVSIDDVKALSRDEALTIYREQYFQKTKIDQLPTTLQAAVLDDAVLSGPVIAIKTLQRHIPDVKVDGIIGPQTLSLATGVSSRELLANLARSRVERYCRIAQRDTSQVVFLVGWVRRAMRFL
jgi:lysozyme family protein